ncbi:MAG: oxidoreductase [Sedimenticola sp.]|uniref:Oxidoreductase n=1 Tax=Sedimenticola thiotaurini TaxID=1543721 RepID=A0A558CVP3_9GAMM|nr:oxidoreductase [Sedimenticola sp.]TVT52825.1 MAG: oxidoreductase [Sedimenticola thiotaurini]
MSEVELGPAVTAKVIESKRITPESTDEVRHIVLRVDEPSFRYMEGQSIGVVVPGPHAFGNKYHMRRYSIANDRPTGSAESVEFSILVRRCFYIDPVNGERYPGTASNFLCDAKPGQAVSITGPYKSPFNVPSDSSANLVMIGVGTGIAPFRAFLQHLYKEKGAWQGQVRLFYGAKTGMDMLYMNDENSDLKEYYDEETFAAYNALAGRPHLADTDALEQSLEMHVEEAWDLFQKPNTYVCVAGLSKLLDSMDKVFSTAAGSEENWQAMKQQMINQGRWSQLFYS